MSNPYDTEEGRKALDRIDEPDIAFDLVNPHDKGARAEAEVAMMDWLAEKWDDVCIEKGKGGPWDVTAARKTEERWQSLRDGQGYQAPTRAEALIAAVNASEGD